MSSPPLTLAHLRARSIKVERLEPSPPEGDAESTARSLWSLAELTGRLSELCSDRSSAALTLAFTLVAEAQRAGEPAAYILSAATSFFPPDVADGGIDLATLLVVRTPDATSAARAADQLARSGAFGLLVLDVAADPVPPAHLSRLLGLAQKHSIAVLFLTLRSSSSTTSGGAAASLGSLISLRAEARRHRHPDGQGFVCELTAVKDKRRAPGWTHQELCRGPAGLR